MVYTMVDKLEAGMESYWVDPMVVVKAVKTAEMMAFFWAAWTAY